MVPSWFMTSQRTPPGVRPASRVRSTAASVWPSRSRTPRGRARGGKRWAGGRRAGGGGGGAGGGETGGAGGRVDRDLDRACPVGGGDAGGDARCGFDRDAE